jgi:hypothetical protein
MNNLPGRCPICGSSEVIVTRFRCGACDVSVQGGFVPERGAFAALNAEQMRFVEVFVKCEGRLNRMEAELDMSYPTIRARLTEIIRCMGYEPGREEQEQPRRRALSESERRRVLDDLEAGRITPDQAMRQLGG